MFTSFVQGSQLSHQRLKQEVEVLWFTRPRIKGGKENIFNTVPNIGKANQLKFSQQQKSLCKIQDKGSGIERNGQLKSILNLIVGGRFKMVTKTGHILYFREVVNKLIPSELIAKPRFHFVWRISESFHSVASCTSAVIYVHD